jgi:signal transduction histidine kinase
MGRRTALEAAAAQVGWAIDRATKELRLRRELDAMTGAAALGRDLDRVRSARAAVRVVTRFVADRFAVPVVSWYADDPEPASLVDVAGLGSRKRREVRRALSTLPLGRGRRARERACRTFADVVEAPRVREHEIGPVMFLVADADAAVDAAFAVARPMLANVLRGLRALDEVDHRTEELHARGAWAAHEIRAPILGLRAALTVFLTAVGRGDPGDTAILRRSIDELEHLAAVAESLLTSTVDGRAPEVRPTDVVPLVHDAIHAIELETGQTRFVRIGAPGAVASADRLYLRTAVDNLLRNALAYSPADTKVTIEVESRRDGVEICVENETAAIEPAEVDLLFAPFVRGGTTSVAHAAPGARRGSGLGLFIASQAVRAQGGRLWAEANGNVIVFHISITSGGKEEPRSAS